MILQDDDIMNNAWLIYSMFCKRATLEICTFGNVVATDVIGYFMH